MRSQADLRLGKFTALKALAITGGFAGYQLTPIERKCLEHYHLRVTFEVWWWQLTGEEPLQEDLVVYEKFIEFRRERQRMNEEKERQKARSKLGGSATKYNIPDPVKE